VVKLEYKGITYSVHLIKLSGKTNECVTRNSNDSYSIFIDVNLNHELQRKAFIYAMKHIIGNDFDKTDADNIELVAHGN
jgi:hypothetical protein